MKRLMLEIFILNVGIMSVEYLYYYSMVKNMISSILTFVYVQLVQKVSCNQ